MGCGKMSNMEFLETQEAEKLKKQKQLSGVKKRKSVKLPAVAHVHASGKKYTESKVEILKQMSLFSSIKAFPPRLITNPPTSNITAWSTTILPE